MLLGAARSLLRAESSEQIVGIVIEAVRDLGLALTVPSGGRTELPLDVTFGHGPPLVPCGPPEKLATLEPVLAGLVEDARVAVQRAQTADQLAESATRDPLTGLANRRVVSRVLGRLTAGDVVVMLDLDHFKAANDAHGHEFGDAVLKSFARALRATVRAADSVGRLGGDEFVLLLRDTDVEEALAVLERLRALWQRMRVGEVGFSAGVAAVAEPGTPRGALRDADDALYRAKLGGRDRCEVA